MPCIKLSPKYICLSVLVSTCNVYRVIKFVLGHVVAGSSVKKLLNSHHMLIFGITECLDVVHLMFYKITSFRKVDLFPFSDKRVGRLLLRYVC
jgi:hypothetical protein